MDYDRTFGGIRAITMKNYKKQQKGAFARSESETIWGIFLLTFRPGHHPSPLHCLQASRIVADELTVRLAKRNEIIETLPYDAGKLPFAKQVIGWYTQTCKELFEYTHEVEKIRKELPSKRAFQHFEQSSAWSFSSLFGPPKIPIIPDISEKELAPRSEDLDKIVFGTECKDPALVPIASHLTNKLFHILERAVARHKPIPVLMAQEVNKRAFLQDLDPSEVQSFLTRTHHQRIAVRLLIGHCVALSRPLPMANMIGIFCTKTPIEEIVLESVSMAEEMCLLTYGCVPVVELSCTVNTQNSLLYIPSHLQHIMFELLKNAMRTVIEKEQQRVGTDGIVNTAALPPIIVHWDINDEQCLFEVKDFGNGIPQDILQDVFLFHYTTAKPPTTETTVMAGYGYGLPLSRIYARFLKGDIWLETVEGEGTSVFVRCKMNWSPDELI